MTAANPPPVTLKLEKVYEPCMLVTKKRYVGFMYESPTQAAPIWDAKVTLYSIPYIHLGRQGDGGCGMGVSRTCSCMLPSWL